MGICMAVCFQIYLSSRVWPEWMIMAAGLFSAWYIRATFRKDMRCHAIRVPFPHLYDRGTIQIPTSVTVAGPNACTCSFELEHPPGWYQIRYQFERLNTEVMRERVNLFVLDWRRWLYFCKKVILFFRAPHSCPGCHDYLRVAQVHLRKT